MGKIDYLTGEPLSRRLAASYRLSRIDDPDGMKVLSLLFLLQCLVLILFSQMWLGTLWKSLLLSKLLDATDLMLQGEEEGRCA